jgi:hypothetical protein
MADFRSSDILVTDWREAYLKPVFTRVCTLAKQYVLVGSDFCVNLHINLYRLDSVSGDLFGKRMCIT